MQISGINDKNGLRVLIVIIMTVLRMLRLRPGGEIKGVEGSRPREAGAAGDPDTSPRPDHPGDTSQTSQQQHLYLCGSASVATTFHFPTCAEVIKNDCPQDQSSSNDQRDVVYTCSCSPAPWEENSEVYTFYRLLEFPSRIKLVSHSQNWLGRETFLS